MKNNTTRKGLAIVASASLLVAGFAGLPAQAAGISDGSVSLVPTTGAEYATVSGGTMTLSANAATGVLGTGKYLKFQVEDALGKTTAAPGAGITDISSSSTAVAATNKITFAGLDNHIFKVGDEVGLSGANDAAQDAANSIGLAFATVTAHGGAQASVDKLTLTGTPEAGDTFSATVTYDGGAAYAADIHTVTAGQTLTEVATSLAALIAANAGITTAAVSGGVITTTAADDNKEVAIAVAVTEFVDITTVNLARAKITNIEAATITVESTISDDRTTVTDDVTLTLLTSTPALGKYIFDSKSDTNTADKVLKLTSTDEDVTQTVTVTAWIDSNDDGDIDTTEYSSPARTVTFLAHSAITSTLTWRPVSVGDATVIADVTFSPTLNGSQYSVDRTNAIGALQVQMTRPGSVELEPSATVTYSNTTKKWTATSKNMNDADWAIADATAQVANAGSSVAIANNIVTMTTIVVHALEVGDTVAVSGSTANAKVNNADAVVLSTPTTKSFTYAVTAANNPAAALTNVIDAAVLMAVTGGNTNILRDSAVTGAYTGQVQLYKDAAVNALTNIGSVTSSVVGTSTASATITAPTFSGIASATVNGSGTAVKTGTNAADYKLSVYNVLGDAVAAGISVTVTTTTVTSAGTVTLNGTTVTTGSTQILTTDASGQVALAVTNTSGAANEAIVFDASVQNVAATQMTSTWAGAVYSILDMDDQNTANSVRTRAAVDGASHTMNLKVQDQWGQAIDGAVYRLVAVATQGTVAITNIVGITAGSATVSVADAGLAGDTVVGITFQKKSTAGVWAAEDTTTVNDWNGVAGTDLGTVAIKYYAATQTDVFTFNADAATLPSGTVSDLTVNVTTKALVAADTRFGGAASTYTAATKAVLGGKIASSTTGAAKSGQTLTVSAVGVLFNVGDVWATDSLTFLSGDGTFSVDAYSRVSGAKVITFTTGALTGTVTATYSSVAGEGGYTISLTTPETVGKGSTYRVEGQILDVNGNGVALTTAGTGANPTLSVTYLGLGLVSGALPTTTDSSGKFYFYVLVGSNDAGTATVTASYDHNGTTTDTTTVVKATASKTVYIGQAAPSDTKVNVGSFKGYVALYAKGYEGKKMSAIVAGKWIVVASLASDFERVVRFTGAGYTITTKIYIDGVMIGSEFTTVTK
jgi:hypothetical protein